MITEYNLYAFIEENTECSFSFSCLANTIYQVRILINNIFISFV